MAQDCTVRMHPYVASRSPLENSASSHFLLEESHDEGSRSRRRGICLSASRPTGTAASAVVLPSMYTRDLLRRHNITGCTFHVKNDQDHNSLRKREVQRSRVLKIIHKALAIVDDNKEENSKMMEKRRTEESMVPQ